MTVRPCANPKCKGLTDDHHQSSIIRGDWCFSCNHWLWISDIVDPARPEDVVIADHVHYLIQPESSGPEHWRGFGGRRFEIEFLDGRKLCTSNLWEQGRIPEHWQDKLPDNARLSNV